MARHCRIIVIGCRRQTLSCTTAVLALLVLVAGATAKSIVMYSGFVHAHVLDVVKLGHELARRGHNVSILTPSTFEQHARAYVASLPPLPAAVPTAVPEPTAAQQAAGTAGVSADATAATAAIAAPGTSAAGSCGADEEGTAAASSTTCDAAGMSSAAAAHDAPQHDDPESQAAAGVIPGGSGGSGDGRSDGGSTGGAGSGATGSLVLLVYPSISLDEYQPGSVKLTLLNTVQRHTDFSLSNCAGILTNDTLLGAAGASAADLIVGDNSDGCLWLLAQRLRLRRVDLDLGGRATFTTNVAHGLTAPLAYVPTFGSGLAGGAMPLHQRLCNVLNYWQLRAVHHFWVEPRLAAFRRKHRILPLNATHAHAAGQAVLTLAAGDLGMIEPHTLLPFVKLVGPLQPEPPKPLPKELDEFVSGSTRGVILISFDPSYRLSVRALMVLAESLIDLKQRFVWQLSPAEEREVRSQYLPIQHAQNVRIVSSLPRNDLLGHPAVTAVLCEASVHSVYEAMYHAKPIIAIPLTLEQEDNVARVTMLGVGQSIGREQLERGWSSYRIGIAFERMSNVWGFTRRAQQLSRAMRAHKRRAVERAADWVEFALESGLPGGAWLPADAQMPMWRAANLDVYAVLLGWPLLLVWGVRLLHRVVAFHAGADPHQQSQRKRIKAW